MMRGLPFPTGSPTFNNGMFNAMNKIVRAATMSAIALAIGMSAVACSGSVEVSPTGGSVSLAPDGSAFQPESSAGSETGAKSAAGAKKTLDAFFAQLGDDLPNHLANTSNSGPRSSEEDTALFQKSFAKSIAYLKPGSFTPEKERIFIGSFAGALYGVDQKAKFEAKESGFQISGDTATIDSDQLVLTIMGKVQDSSSDSAAKNTFTLTFVDGKWLITGYSGLNGI